MNLAVTTAGFDRHSICWEQHAYAEQVLQGLVHDSAFFPLILAAAPDWTDPEVWKKANPSFGVTVSPDQFAEVCREAQESPAKENSFRRYRLNQWTEQDVRWLSLEKWDACAKEPVDLESRECYGGLDLSSTTDLTALAVRLVEGPIEDTRIEPDRPADVLGLEAADLGVVNDAGFDVDATDAAGHLEEAGR